MSAVFLGIRRIVRETALIICAAAVLFCGYLGAVGWTERREAARAVQASTELAEKPSMLTGKQLAIRGMEMGRHGYSLIIVTSPTCPFCKSSVAFHHRLIAAAKHFGMPLWIAVPTSAATKSFLSASNFHDAPVINWRDLSRRATGTPSVVLLDSSGLICRIWLGELRGYEEAELLTIVGDPSSVSLPSVRKLTSGENMLTEAELRALPGRDNATLVSIAEREEFRQEHPARAINIPLPELSQRAERDLRRDRLNVIDCSVIDDMLCSLTIEDLRKRGFRLAAVDFSHVK